MTELTPIEPRPKWPLEPRLPGRIHVVQAVLRPMERERLIEHWPPTRLSPSAVRTATGPRRSKQRTSQHAVLTDPAELVRKVRDAVAAATGLPAENQEPALIVRYGIGGYFGLHHDQPLGVAGDAMEASGGRRAFSAIVSLRLPLRGGLLQFPDLRSEHGYHPAEYGPYPGNMLWWSNATRDVRHQVRPVLQGERYSVVVFVRERQYDPSHDLGAAY